MILKKVELFNFAFWVLILLNIVSCKKDPNIQVDSVSQPAVVLVVWDGVRLEDITNSDGSLKGDIVPFMTQLSIKSNSFFTTKFYHQGYTYTMAGHLAFLTGQHFLIKNDVSGIAPLPTILHRILHKKQVGSEKTWIIATKNKICSLNNCEDSICNEIPMPSGICNLYGIWGPMDSRTFQAAVDIIRKHKPVFLLVSFAAPDIIAHAGDYEGYIKAIKQVDHYTSQLYSLVSSVYEDSVMFIISTDHGRHKHNFRGHGDKCRGCTSLFLLINMPFEDSFEFLFSTFNDSIVVHEDVFNLMVDFVGV